MAIESTSPRENVSSLAQQALRMQKGLIASAWAACVHGLGENLAANISPIVDTICSTFPQDEKLRDAHLRALIVAVVVALGRTTSNISTAIPGLAKAIKAITDENLKRAISRTAIDMLAKKSDVSTGDANALRAALTLTDDECKQH